MICEELDFYLLGELSLHACLFDLFFVYHFYGQNKACSQISSHVNIAKTTFAQLSTHLELTECKLLRLSGGQHAAKIKKRRLTKISVVPSGLAFLHEQFFVNFMGTFLQSICLILFILSLFGTCFI